MEPSSLAIGCCPPATSMMDSRRMPSATSGATKYRLSSGPRWTIASHMARTVRAASSAPSCHPANTAMPHICLRLRPRPEHDRLIPGTQVLDHPSFAVLGAGVGLGGGAERLGSAGRVDHGP